MVELHSLKLTKGEHIRCTDVGLNVDLPTAHTVTEIIGKCKMIHLIHSDFREPSSS